jgi:hypothetical protein
VPDQVGAREPTSNWVQWYCETLLAEVRLTAKSMLRVPTAHKIPITPGTGKSESMSGRNCRLVSIKPAMAITTPE